MKFKQFKIIPLLVFVAMLSFSVRVVEIISGLSSNDGKAIAAQTETIKENQSTEINADTDKGMETEDLEMAETDLPPAGEESEICSMA